MNKSIIALIVVWALVLTAVLLAAANRETFTPLHGGILVTFAVQGETMKVWITNQQTIDDVFAVYEGRSSATIPNGKLVRGSAYGNPWSWHLDPEDIEMASMTIELLDGLPSHVEENLDYWIDTVGRFAPWRANIVGIQDWR